MALIRNLYWGRLRAALGFWLCVSTLAAQAHGLRPDLLVQVDPPTLAGLHVEVHQGHIAPQLVLENRTQSELLLYDTQNVAFLRFHQGKVWVNKNSVDAQRSLNPGAFVQQRKRPVAKTSVQWQLIREQASYGWFDPRINPEPIEIPMEITVLDEALPAASWRIPAELDGNDYAITGQFIYQPAPKGAIHNVLRTPQPAPGISLNLAPGPVPALFLDNHSEQDVLILDENGQGFIRIGPQGVHVDTDHPRWQSAKRPGQISQQGWQKLSQAPRFAWLETRAVFKAATPRSQQSQLLAHWQVPIRLGENKLNIIGSHVWQAFESQAQSAK